LQSIQTHIFAAILMQTENFLHKTFLLLAAVEWCLAFALALARFQLNYNLIFTIMFIYLKAPAAAAAILHSEIQISSVEKKRQRKKIH
jgi:multisubunit Na+/H+ antiporter MnhG subunit